MALIANNLASVRTKIAATCQTCARVPNTVKLIAVSKTKPTQMIEEALSAGQFDFGENYAQEFKAKALALPNINWHFIGHLQSNKVKDVVGTAKLIHTLDRPSLAEAIAKQAEKLGVVQDCLIEVKLARDGDKQGCPPEDLLSFAASVSTNPFLHIRGLMTIGTATTDRDLTRSEFATLKHLLGTLNQTGIFADPLTELSMGMSHDFSLAISEGATLVRVGSAIFGDR